MDDFNRILDSSSNNGISDMNNNLLSTNELTPSQKFELLSTTDVSTTAQSHLHHALLHIFQLLQAYTQLSDTKSTLPSSSSGMSSNLTNDQEEIAQLVQTIHTQRTAFHRYSDLLQTEMNVLAERQKNSPNINFKNISHLFEYKPTPFPNEPQANGRDEPIPSERLIALETQYKELLASAQKENDRLEQLTEYMRNLYDDINLMESTYQG